jgi:hypothetical protein
LGDRRRGLSLGLGGVVGAAAVDLSVALRLAATRGRAVCVVVELSSERGCGWAGLDSSLTDDTAEVDPSAAARMAATRSCSCDGDGDGRCASESDVSMTSVAAASVPTRACSCNGDDDGSSASESDISMTSVAAALVVTRALACGVDGSSESESEGISMGSLLSSGFLFV